MNVTIDAVPDRCKVMVVRCGRLTCVFAENIDTGTTGPVITVSDGVELGWADLDPKGEVA